MAVPSGPGAAGDLHVVAAHEAARRIGLVELLAQDAAGDRPLVAVESLLEAPLHEAEDVEHQVLSDEAAAVREAIRKPARLRVQQDARRADAVARHDYDLGALAALVAVLVVVDDAVREAPLVERDLAHATPGAQLDAALHRLRPVGDVGARLAALGAAAEAGAEVAAAISVFVGLGDDRAVRRPPVPAELVVAPRQRLADEAHRDRRQRRILRRVHGIARDA